VTVWATDPDRADTDAGSIGDGEEVARGTDPLDPTDDQAVEPVEPVGAGASLRPAAQECGCGSTSVPAGSFGVLGLLVAALAAGRRVKRKA